MEEQPKKPSRMNRLSMLCTKLNTTMEGVKGAWDGLKADGKIPSKPTKELTDEEFDQAIKLVEDTFA